MAQSGYTPISLYFSATGAAVPTAGNLVAGELALNTNDGKLYFKNSSGVVTLLAGSTSGPAGGSTTQVQYNNAGVLAGITGATTNGTALTLVAPVLGTPASGTVTNLTGTASININGTVGATTASTGAFTTVSATGLITGRSTNGQIFTATNSADSTFSLDISSAKVTISQLASAGTLDTVIGSTTRTSLSSTGLAVTGTLSATGAGFIEGLTVGRGAGAVATNTAVGFGTLQVNTSGVENTAIGQQALLTNTSGSSNTATGRNALALNSTGGNNAAFGVQALQSNTTASNNTAVGYQAGYSQTTADGNVLIGISAGYGLTTGNLNTFVGASCGVSMSTGTKNTILGRYSGNQGGLDIRTASNYIVLSDGDGNPRGVFDSSGNLGIGTAPSAQNIGISFELQGGASLSGSTFPNMYLTSNAVYNSGWTYKQNGYANYYLQQSGIHSWTTAPSGTAGNAISFTQAMTLDASGNLGIGTSSPAAKLHIAVASAAVDGTKGVRITNPAGTVVVLECGSVSDSFVGSTTSDFSIRAGNVECAHFTTGGNVGIGTSSPAYRLDVAGEISQSKTSNTTVASGGFDASTSWGLKIANASTTAGTGAGIYFLGGTNSESYIGNLYDSSGAGALSFQTRVAGVRAERMRIDSSGFFKARANGGAYFGGSSNQILNNNNTSGDVCLLIGNAAGNATNNTSSYSFIAADASGDRLYIYGNGNVVNINNSYGTLSDVKLKENIVDATPKLDDVMRLQVRNFNLKSNPELKQIGFVAQELEQIFPALIDESPDRDAEGNITEEMTKSIKTSVLVPILVKAMQEQQALITQLTARITALETA